MVNRSDVVQLALDLTKATFDTVFLSYATLQGQVEDWALDWVRGSAWVPTPVAGVATESVGFARRTRADFKSTVDRCYVLLSVWGMGADPEPAPATHAPSRGVAAAAGAGVH